MIAYTNNPASGYDIAKRFHKRGVDGKPTIPAVLLRAWFSDLAEAEAYMRASPHPATTANRRIIDRATGTIVAWRGVIHAVSPIGARGEGENAISLDDWLAFRDRAAAPA